MEEPVLKKTAIAIASLFVAMVFSLSPLASAGTNDLTVSAAMSLKNAFEEIGVLYEREHRGLKVIFNFGASGDLVRQIEGGAPVDIFASASEKEMDEIMKRGLVVPGSRRGFARNSLVLIVPAAQGRTTTDFAGLSRPSVKRIAVGNPATVPAGRYAEEVFNYYRLNAIKDKLVFTANVRQVLDYVARGEVDAGVVYRTDALLRARDVRIVAVAPDESHSPAVSPLAVVKGTRFEGPAGEFIATVLSPGGRKILERYGFTVHR